MTFLVYGVYLVRAEVQEDHAREVHPDRQDGFLVLRKGMKMWKDWCLRQKKKNSKGKDPRTFEENTQGFDPSTQERNSQGKDPRTLAESSKGGNVSTHQKNSQRKDTRTLEAPVKRWRVQKKRKKKKWKRKKRKKKKHVKHRRNLWWTQRKEQFANFLVSERKEEDFGEKKAERGLRVQGRNNVWEDLEDGSS